MQNGLIDAVDLDEFILNIFTFNEVKEWKEYVDVKLAGDVTKLTDLLDRKDPQASSTFIFALNTESQALFKYLEEYSSEYVREKYREVKVSGLIYELTIPGLKLIDDRVDDLIGYDGWLEMYLESKIYKDQIEEYNTNHLEDKFEPSHASWSGCLTDREVNIEKC